MGRQRHYIGVRLRLLRQDRGMSQTELSFRSGISQTQISKIENNLVEPRLSTIAKLSRALGVDPTYFTL